MNAAFRVIVIGGTGQVGGAVVHELIATSECLEIVMITRKPIAIVNPRIRNVVMDTGAGDFETRVADLAKEVVASGDRVAAVSCVGVGSGSYNWSEEQLKQLEVGVVGSFARGVRAAGITQFCLLSAVGSSSRSLIQYSRVMGLKEEVVQAANFPRLAIFRPGIIVGNSHTPVWVGWLGKLIPGPWGNIDQRDIGKAFVAEIVKNSTKMGVEYFDNQAMRRLIDKNHTKLASSNLPIDQPIPKVSHSDVERIARREYAGDDVKLALSILSEYQSDGGSPARVQLAALKLARGNIVALQRAIETAKYDYRDVLAPAEYPRYSREIGFKGAQESLRQEIINDDWKQYELWLKL